MGRLTLQIMSDIHLEFSRDDFDVKKVGNCIALVGDIGIYSKSNYEYFLTKLSQIYDHVFVVAGNHEYYNQEYHAANTEMSAICMPLDNVHFLQQSSFLYEDGTNHPVRILGCTLWSNVPISSKEIVSKCLNDYRTIRIQDGSIIRALTVDDTNSIP
ncbi:hypothetical protein AKO1_008143 [Acrasis kona]|uniref:Calcineurin-like phosphoesterase domain-containing protein n=1 Tax=Acrasis kona TaxID=1008807 RepID=A0AAW2YMY2_9EUKA